MAQTLERTQTNNHIISGDDRVKGKLSLVLYAAGTALAFVTPVASYVAYVAVAVMWFVPDRRLAPLST